MRGWEWRKQIGKDLWWGRKRFEVKGNGLFKCIVERHDPRKFTVTIIEAFNKGGYECWVENEPTPQIFEQVVFSLDDFHFMFRC